MPALVCTDVALISYYEKANYDISKTAIHFGLTPRRIHERISSIEKKTGIKYRTGRGSRVLISRDTKPNPIDMNSGCIVVASDCHYWPDEVATAHKALVKLCKQLGPDIVVINGDEFDGASISRHVRNGWEKRPTVAAEIKEVQARMHEIKRASGRAKLLGTFGNHTMRYDTYLSGHAALVEGVAGTKYEDLVPAWNYAWAWLVNGHTLIKHRHKGGIHATWNNTGEAQISTVTGHCHALQVRPRSTMSPVNGGTIYGVDTGMLADPWGPQFAYMEQGPRNWRSGFAVLTFIDGILMPPELCQVLSEGVAWFRGNKIEV